MPQLGWRAMGCEMLALTDGAARSLAALPAQFERWEQCLSRFRPDSELQRLNVQAGQPVPVSATLWAVLVAALAAARASDGLVVPTLLPALEAAGYDRPFDQLAPASEPPAPALPPPPWQAIRLDPARRTVTLPEGMRLDLGGIAKGWAADQAVQGLGPSALVDAGGDIATSGPRADGSPWPVGVADPRAPAETLALLRLAGEAVATSGSDYRRWQRAGQWQHHLLDPRTGRPAPSALLSVTVVAPSALRAEIATKHVFLLGRRAGLAWLEEQPSLAALLVGTDGTLTPSRQWPRHLWA